MNMLHLWLAGWALCSLPLLAAEPGGMNFQVERTLDENKEGPAIERPWFTIGRVKMAFRAPQNCQLTSSPESLRILFSSEKLSGQVTFATSPFAPAKYPLETEVEAYRKGSAEQLPRDAENVVAIDPVTNAYIGHEWPNLTFAWTYTRFAHPTYEQIAYLNVDAEHQICIRLLCEESSREAMTNFAQRFVASWFPLE